MYEDMTFENIMDRCLDRVSSSIDKREGSVVYDAIAPAVSYTHLRAHETL